MNTKTVTLFFAILSHLFPSIAHSKANCEHNLDDDKIALHIMYIVKRARTCVEISSSPKELEHYQEMVGNIDYFVGGSLVGEAICSFKEVLTKGENQYDYSRAEVVSLIERKPFNITNRKTIGCIEDPDPILSSLTEKWGNEDAGIKLTTSSPLPRITLEERCRKSYGSGLIGNFLASINCGN